MQGDVELMSAAAASATASATAAAEAERARRMAAERVEQLEEELAAVKDYWQVGLLAGRITWKYVDRRLLAGRITRKYVDGDDYWPVLLLESL